MARAEPAPAIAPPPIPADLPPEEHLRPSPALAPVWVAPAALILLGAALVSLYLWGSDALKLGALLGTLPITGGLMGYVIFRQRRFGRANADAAALLAQRRVEEALAAFDENARAFRRPVAHHAESILGVAVTRLLMGEGDGALRCLAAVERYPGSEGWATIHERVPGWTALALVAAGREAEARAWLAEAKRRCDATSAVLALMPQAILQCRDGDWDGAAQRLTRAWTDAQVALVAPILPELRLVRALALSHLPEADARRQEIEPLLAHLAGGGAGAATWLRTGWPALDGFIRGRLEP